MPSSCPGMKFCSTRAFEGYTVYFSMDNSCDLLLCLEQGESIIDLILLWLFTGLLLHWCNHDINTIELRLLVNAWNHLMDNWLLSKHDSTWKLS